MVSDVHFMPMQSFNIISWQVVEKIQIPMNSSQN
jgi:hypothetical protein